MSNKFSKIPEKQYNKDTDINYKGTYDKIILPKRATLKSCGYDIFSPISFQVQPQETIKIATGLRVKVNDGWFLAIIPRSSLGFTYRTTLSNTIAAVDGDYFDAENFGHIFIKFSNLNTEGKVLKVDAGTAIFQALFLPYGVTDDDKVSEQRRGGLGSTNR